MRESPPIETFSIRHGPVFLAAAVLATVLGFSPVAYAQNSQSSVPLAQSSSDCMKDVKVLQQRRMKLIDQFNQMAKSHGGKLDPIAACPKLKVLADIESSFKAFMVKNKDWCNIPDQAITNIAESHAKTAALATRVCNVAAQFKKQQTEEAAGGPGATAPMKLPTGPL